LDAGILIPEYNAPEAGLGPKKVSTLVASYPTVIPEKLKENSLFYF
jgi:hypothetical protein